jgi:hypothetical protein
MNTTEELRQVHKLVGNGKKREDAKEEPRRNEDGAFCHESPPTFSMF